MEPRGLGTENQANGNLDPLAKRVNRELVKTALEKRGSRIDAQRTDMQFLAARRPFELRSFQDLFVAYSFIPKLLEHIGGITKLQKKGSDKEALESLMSQVYFEGKEICFPHFYPRTKASTKLFAVRSDRASNLCTF